MIYALTALDAFGVQKLHEHDQRAGWVSVPRLDHLHLTGRYTGKCGQTRLGVAASLTNGFECGGGHGRANLRGKHLRVDVSAWGFETFPEEAGQSGAALHLADISTSHSDAHARRASPSLCGRSCRAGLFCLAPNHGRKALSKSMRSRGRRITQRRLIGRPLSTCPIGIAKDFPLVLRQNIGSFRESLFEVSKECAEVAMGAVSHLRDGAIDVRKTANIAGTVVDGGGDDPLFFALDYYRMRRLKEHWRDEAYTAILALEDAQQRGDYWRSAATLKTYAEGWWQDLSAPHIDPQPRDERGRFAKRKQDA